MRMLNIVEGQRGVVLRECMAHPVVDRSDQFFDALNYAFGGHGHGSQRSFQSVTLKNSPSHSVERLRRLFSGGNFQAGRHHAEVCQDFAERGLRFKQRGQTQRRKVAHCGRMHSGPADDTDVV